MNVKIIIEIHDMVFTFSEQKYPTIKHSYDIWHGKLCSKAFYSRSFCVQIMYIQIFMSI